MNAHIEEPYRVVGFHYLNECAGSEDSVFVEPARKSFDTAEFAGLRVDLGLVIRSELIFPQACFDVDLKLLAFGYVIQHLLGKPYDIVTFFHLGFDQRLRGENENDFTFEVASVDLINADTRGENDLVLMFCLNIYEGNLNTA